MRHKQAITVLLGLVITLFCTGFAAAQNRIQPMERQKHNFSLYAPRGTKVHLEFSVHDYHVITLDGFVRAGRDTDPPGYISDKYYMVDTGIKNAITFPDLTLMGIDEEWTTIYIYAEINSDTKIHIEKPVKLKDVWDSDIIITFDDNLLLQIVFG